jgi:hypothetical protein
MNCLKVLGVETDSPTIAPTILQPTFVPRDTPSNFPPAPMSSTGTALPAVQFVALNPKNVLAICEGDCDSDADCEGTLKCFQRNNGDEKTYLIPGCAEPLGINTGIDICYNASFVSTPSV